MGEKEIDRIKGKMQEKTTDELLGIWRRNDTSKWSAEAFEAIKRILTARQAPIPGQNMSPEAQHKQETVQKLQALPHIPLKKAIRLERNFSVWSILLVIWIIFGFFHIVHNFQEVAQYQTAISNLKSIASSSGEVKPEFADVANRLSPHIEELERLTVYLWTVAIVSIPVWITLFFVWKKFDLRKRQGPKVLLLLLSVMVAVHLFGALLSYPIPMRDAAGLIAIVAIRVMPIAYGMVMLLFIPFFGKTADVFYQYTAIEPECFQDEGVGIQVLRGSESAGTVRSLSSLAVFSLVLCPLPYIGLPMAIASVRKISKSEGRLYGRTLAWISVVVNALLLGMIVFGITMAVLSSK